MASTSGCYPRTVVKRKAAVDRQREVSLKNPHLYKKYKSEAPIQLLSLSNISDGMVVLGCITHVNDFSIKFSLPGCLEGTVSLADISKIYLSCLNENQKPSDEAQVILPFSLPAVFHEGMCYPCKIMTVKQCTESNESLISLTLDPSHVNEQLQSAEFYPNMVIYGAVKSIEEHGLILNIGLQHRYGFVNIDGLDVDESHIQVQIGEIIPTVVTSVSENVVQLLALSVHSHFRKVQDMPHASITNLLPGMIVDAIVTKITEAGVYVKCLQQFDGCILKEHLPNNAKKTIGCKVAGTILYIDQVSHFIYLSLTLKLPYCSLPFRKWDLIEEAVVATVKKNHIFFDLGRNVKGLALEEDLPKNPPVNIKRAYSLKSVHRCRVISVHPLDSIVKVSLKPSILNLKIIKESEITVGAIFEGKVTQHVGSGMIVSLCPEVNGFVRDIHMTDGPVLHSNVLYAPGKTVKCRVLSIKKGSFARIQLTCKPQLLHADFPILSSYDDAKSGFITKGVIVDANIKRLVVSFFNDVHGYIPKSGFKTGISYSSGQVVKCIVTDCNTRARILKLSLKLEEAAKKYIVPHVILPPVAKEAVRVGEFASVVVKSKLADGLLVQFTNSEHIGYMPVYHLSDQLKNAKFLIKTYEKNDKIEVLCFSREKERIIVTRKFCFFKAALNGSFPQGITDIKQGDLYPAVVCSLNTNGIVLTLGNNIMGFVPTKLMQKGKSEGISCGQSIVAKAIDIRKTRVIMSMRGKDVFVDDYESSLDVLESYLSDEVGIKKRYNGRSGVKGKLSNVDVGSLISVRILEILENTVFGIKDECSCFAARDKCADVLDIYEYYTAVVLHCDFVQDCLRISFSPKLLRYVEKRRCKSLKVSINQIIESQVVFIHEDFVLAVLRSHAVGTFVYLPPRRALNDVCGHNDAYILGNIYNVIVKRFVANLILGVLVQHDKVLSDCFSYTEIDDDDCEVEHTSFVKSSDCPQVGNEDNKELAVESDATCEIKHISLFKSSDCPQVSNEDNSELTVGQICSAVVKSIEPTEVRILINERFPGRIHVTETGLYTESVFPVTTFQIGQIVEVQILGTYPEKSYNCLAVSDLSTTQYFECAINGRQYVPVNKKFAVGEMVMGFVEEIDDSSVTLWLSPTVKGKLPYVHLLDFTIGIEQNLQTLKHFFAVGCSHALYIWKISEDERITLTQSVSWEPLLNCIVRGAITNVNRISGITLKLNHDYSGEIKITDIDDDFSNVQSILSEYNIGDLVYGLILDVDFQTRSCSLTSRQSRLSVIHQTIVDKELSVDDVSKLKKGDFFRVFVKAVLPQHMIVTLGRELEGIIELKGNMSKSDIGDLISAVIKHVDGKYILLEAYETESGFHENKASSLSSHLHANMEIF